MTRPEAALFYAKRGSYMRGTIKRVIRERGFGFIRTSDGKEVFFHRTNLQQLNFEELNEGDGVEFEVEQGAKGPRAIDVRAAKS